MIAITTKLLVVFLALLCVAASPAPGRRSSMTPFDGLQLRTTEPYFPDDPASCPICEQNYGDIDGCIQAAPVLANFSMIIFNPGAFIDVIRCACTDTFKSVFPQCADCFVKTNQSDVLDAPDLPDVVDGMRKICALESTLLGNVSSTNNESIVTAAPSPTSNAAWTSSLGLGLGPVLPMLAAVVLGAVGGALAL
ncbi:hypothetical protein BD626DRAFT_431892 [Schizophyllum amplum]|uniref:Uncharacterized protein n=1 Tax=Schizophyllum amplum TaxID=97359 RepID=A0A550CEN0_9AGAR|nr:hypothetical protein BD626DRAFT_431892 [Auriculariopsis ampla]